MRRFLLAIVSAAALLLPLSTSGIIVFDPSNFAQNTISAIHAVSAEIQRAQQFLLQTQQYVTQMRNLAKMTDPGAIIRDYAPEVDAAMKYVGTLRTLYGDLKTLRETVDQQFKEQAMSGLSWDKYVEREIVLSQRKAQSAQAAFGAIRGAMERLDSDYTQMREAQAKIRTTDGAQGQMELTNQQLNQLVAINREMLTSISALVQAAAERNLSKGAEEQHGGVEFARDLNRARAAASQAATDGANRLRAGQDTLYQRTR